MFWSCYVHFANSSLSTILPTQCQDNSPLGKKRKWKAATNPKSQLLLADCSWALLALECGWYPHCHYWRKQIFPLPTPIRSCQFWMVSWFGVELCTLLYAGGFLTWADADLVLLVTVSTSLCEFVPCFNWKMLFPWSCLPPWLLETTIILLYWFLIWGIK